MELEIPVPPYSTFASSSMDLFFVLLCHSHMYIHNSFPKVGICGFIIEEGPKRSRNVAFPIRGGNNTQTNSYVSVPALSSAQFFVCFHTHLQKP